MTYLHAARNKGSQMEVCLHEKNSCSNIWCAYTIADQSVGACSPADSKHGIP